MRDKIWETEDVKKFDDDIRQLYLQKLDQSNSLTKKVNKVP